MSKAIQIRLLSKTFNVGFFRNKKNEVLKNLNIDIEKWDIYWLIWPNWAGKTTLINCIMWFETIDSGQIEFFWSKLNQKVLWSIWYASDSTSYYGYLTWYETTICFGRLLDQDKKNILEKADFLFQKLWLSFAKDNLVSTYSTGMRKRLGIIISLINDPDIVIRDEPMNGLDPLGKNLVCDVVLDLKKKWKTIIFCTHILDDVQTLCNKFGILLDGKIYDEKKISDINLSLDDYFKSKIIDKVSIIK